MAPRTTVGLLRGWASIRTWPRVVVAALGAMLAADAGSDMVVDTLADNQAMSQTAFSPPNRLEEAAKRESAVDTSVKSLAAAVMLVVATIGAVAPRGMTGPAERPYAPVVASVAARAESNFDATRVAQVLTARGSDVAELLRRNLAPSVLEKAAIEGVRVDVANGALRATVDTMAQDGEHDQNALILIVQAAQALLEEKAQTIATEGLLTPMSTEQVVGTVIDRQLRAAQRLAGPF